MTNPPGWIETEGTVTTCRYQFARLNTLSLGFQRGERFRITFDYRAHGQIYSDEFESPVAIPQDTRIPVRYNPLDPQQNSRSREAGGFGAGRSPLLAVGIAGSVVLSLLWLAMLRGCS